MGWFIIFMIIVCVFCGVAQGVSNRRKMQGGNTFTMHCRMCGANLIYSKANTTGLCNSCHQKFMLTIPRLFEVFKESQKIVSSSRNIEIKVSRQQLSLEKLLEAKDFGGDIDAMNIVDPQWNTDEVIELIKGALDDLYDIQHSFDEIILGVIRNHGTATRKDIVNVLVANAMEEVGNLDDFPYDVGKMLPDILKRLESNNIIDVQKRGNSYIYSLC